MARYAGTAVLLGLLAGVAAALVLWWTPANDFLIVPDKAKPLGAWRDEGWGRYYDKDVRLFAIERSQWRPRDEPAREC